MLPRSPLIVRGQARTTGEYLRVKKMLDSIFFTPEVCDGAQTSI